MTTPAGWYHGEGDAPGTVRYWNGTEWAGPAVEQAGGIIQTGTAYEQPSGSFVQRLVSIRGRVNRTTYALFMGGNIVAAIALAAIDEAIGTYNANADLGMLSSIWSLALLWPGIATGVKRVHDWGTSGWLMLLALVPLVNLIFALVLLLKRGNPGPNSYGPPRSAGFGL